MTNNCNQLRIENFWVGSSERHQSGISSGEESDKSCDSCDSCSLGNGTAGKSSSTPGYVSMPVTFCRGHFKSKMRLP